MEYGRNINYTLLYFLPQKYIRPALFTPDDSASGSIDVKHIINMLIVGATGTGKTVALKNSAYEDCTLSVGRENLAT